MSLVLTDLWRYPVKSCRGEQVRDAAVEPWGLAGDRRWMVVDLGGEVVTARERPRMVLVTPHLQDGALLLTGPGRPDLIVPVPPGDELIPVTVWDSKLLAAPADPAADAWFSEVIGEPARLVYLDDPMRRPTDQTYSGPGDRVSFADGYPLLLTTESSLAGLNKHIAAGQRASEGPLPMRRFRPSVVIEGAAPWAEDAWRLLRIGDVAFRAVKGCARCVLTMIDPDTAASGKEPIATLARIRRWDGQVWFGVNLIPDSPRRDSSIRIGDPVEVLERDDRAGGPLR
jgi:uncharacterized protein YcbX